ncbi:MAG: helix-hairpin-helix domain-containing protein [Tannerellaceae bacterium]|jgi:DNA uptake protein ComE-like DNA-binding protein|nr:helix-hairpin-helix domain-containing protein [Tannerellaceae bacterium]
MRKKKTWRDLLYFTREERRSLIVLLLLIFIGGALLVLNDLRKEASVAGAEPPQYIVNPANAPLPVVVETPRAPASSPPPQRKASPRRKTPFPSYPRTEKYPVGTIVELNTADTVTLKKVPGIGSVFARRIVNYRALLGGFYSVSQLREVYGMDEERYQSLHSWFYADTSFIAKLPVNHLSSDLLAKHPYLNYKQANILQQLRHRKGQLTGWESLRLLEEFTEADRERLVAYLSFQ